MLWLCEHCTALTFYRGHHWMAESHSQPPSFCFFRVDWRAGWTLPRILCARSGPKSAFGRGEAHRILHLTLLFLLIWTIISTWSVVFDEVKIYVLGHCVKIYAFKNSSWCQISHLILLFNNWMMSTAILLLSFTCGHINSYFYCFFTVGYNFKSKWLWVF